jgi:Immunoglobulin-like domain of bacterial spore germination
MKYFFACIISVVICFFIWKVAYAPVPAEITNEQVTAVTQAVASTSSEPLSNFVVVSEPVQDAKVKSPIKISGKAPGSWYFEGSFPVVVADQKGAKIGTGIAQAQGEWMTTELVPFSLSVDVGSYKGVASVTLLRDNPSGLPENDDSVSVMVNVH